MKSTVHPHGAFFVEESMKALELYVTIKLVALIAFIIVSAVVLVRYAIRDIRLYWKLRQHKHPK